MVVISASTTVVMHDGTFKFAQDLHDNDVLHGNFVIKQVIKRDVVDLIPMVDLGSGSQISPENLLLTSDNTWYRAEATLPVVNMYVGKLCELKFEERAVVNIANKFVIRS